MNQTRGRRSSGGAGAAPVTRRIWSSAMLLVERGGDRLRVAEHDGGGVGVGAVDDRLHRRGAAGVELCGEIGRDHQRESGVAPVDGALELARSSRPAPRKSK